MNLQRVKPIPPKDESLVYESPFFNNKQIIIEATRLERPRLQPTKQPS